MEDFSSMTGAEMFARRDAAEAEISGLIGKLVFGYSRFVTALHLCVAWRNEGKDVNSYGDIAEDFAVAELLRRIEKQALVRLGKDSVGFKRYKSWLRRAHQNREKRNMVMHSRWSIEAYGRYAIAVTTPIFVEPAKEIAVTANQLREMCHNCEKLVSELSVLREEHIL